MIKKICLMTRGGKEVVGRRVVVTSEFEANRENIWCKIHTGALNHACTVQYGRSA